MKFFLLAQLMTCEPAGATCNWYLGEYQNLFQCGAAIAFEARHPGRTLEDGSVMPTDKPMLFQCFSAREN